MKFQRQNITAAFPFTLRRSSLLIGQALLGGLVMSGVAQADAVRQLDTITVKAHSIAGAEPKTNWQTLDKSNVVDMKDVLSKQSAVSVSGGQGVAQHIFIRGLGENYLSFSVDGASNNAQIFHHQSRFMFDPILLKQVEIEKGSGAASAGIGVLGGAVKMTTVDATDLLLSGRNVGARLSVGASSNRGWERSAGIYGRLGESADALLFGNWVTQRDYEVGGKGDKVPFSAVDNSSFLGKVGFNFSPDHRVTLSHRREQQKGDRPLRLNIVGLRGLPPFNGKLTQDTSIVNYRGKNLGFISQIDANIFHISMHDVKTAMGKMPTKGRILPAHSDTKAQTTGADLGFSSALGSHVLKYGINWREEQISAAKHTVGRGKEDKTEWGAYLEGVWNFAPVMVTTGVRYDHFDLTNTSGQSRSGGTVNPSIALAYEVNPSLTFTASVAQASRSPRLYEPYILSLSNGANYKTKGSVKAERAVNKEIGFEWSNGMFSIAGNVFHQQINDYLGNDANGMQANIGKLTNSGYELNAAYQQGGLTGRIGVAENRPRVNGGYSHYGLKTVPTGRQWQASLAYRFDNPSLELGWQAQAVEAFEGPIFDGKGKQTAVGKKNGYAVHNVFMNWQPLGNDQMNVNLSVNNLGDKFYRSQSNFCGLTGLANCPAESGRNVRLTANYRF